MAASNVLPEYICSTSADAEAAGFVVIKNKWNYFSKEEGVKKIAEFMGGLLAEKLIFGEDKITRGAESDIERATELAAKLVKDYGMGNTIASIDLHGFGSRFSYLDKNYDCNDEVKVLLEQGMVLAEKILLQEKQLLLNLADHLSDERLIKKESIAEMVKKYGSHHLRSVSFIEDGKHLFYWAHLKNQVKNHHSVVVKNMSIDETHISLNKGK
jgi:ATP-dependent Zn protease